MAERSTRRIVVTGLGLVTPLGTGVDKTWAALCAGQSGIGRITKFDPAAYDAQIAGEVRDFDPRAWMPSPAGNMAGRFSQFAVAAAKMAAADSRQLNFFVASR